MTTPRRGENTPGKRIASGEYIPGDLLSEILVRLPVKSVLICKSVCKPWLSIISNPNFINSHLKHTLAKPGADQTLIVKGEDDYSMSLLHLDSPEIRSPLGLPFSQGDFPFEPKYDIVGSCNGIVCVSVCDIPRDRAFQYDTNLDTYLWNPATKQSKLIPPHNLQDGIMSESIAFGFDPIGDDYKVFKIVSFDDDTMSYEVYSASNNVWGKEKPFCPEYNGDHDFNLLEDFLVDGEFGVCVNGFFCCLGFYGIIAFDLKNEVFTFHNPLPARSSSYCFTDFNSSIAVITSKENEKNHTFNLWRLDDEACLRGGRVKASWTLMLSFDARYPDLRVCGCFNSGDFLLSTEGGSHLLYNSHKKEAKNVPAPITIGHRFFKYSESLVSITGSKQVEWNAHQGAS